MCGMCTHTMPQLLIFPKNAGKPSIHSLFSAITSALQHINILLILILICLSCSPSFSLSLNNSITLFNISNFSDYKNASSSYMLSYPFNHSQYKNNLSLISLNSSSQVSQTLTRLNNSLQASISISSIDSSFADLSIASSPPNSPAYISQDSDDDNGGSQYMWIVQGNSTGKAAPNCSDLCVIAKSDLSSVDLQPCEGLSSNELWLYDPNSHFLISKFESISATLCVDASEPQNLQLRTCNSSVDAQIWDYNDETMQLRGGLATSNSSSEPPMYLMGQIRHLSSWGSGINDFTLQLAAENSLNTNNFSSIFTLIPFINPLMIEANSYNSSANAQNLVRNGGFEECNIDPGKGFVTIDNTEPLYLCSWYVVINEVEYSGTNLWQPQQGTHSLHLNSAKIAQPSSIIQRIRTKLGSNYTLGFYMAGNPDLNCGDTNKTMSVEVLPSSLAAQELWFDVSMAGAGKMGYMHVYPLGFTAHADHVNLTFTSLTAGSCGAVIDTISIQEITGPLPPLPDLHAGHSRSGMPAYAKALLALAVIALVFTSLSLLIMKLKKKKPPNPRSISMGERTAQGWWDSFKLEAGSGETANGLIQELTWKQIEKATKNFTTIVGEGGFSTVYKAELADGRVGAVKMEKTRDRSRQLFKQELSVLVRLHHPNLVNLIGYCNEREEGILVFEYMAHGSLHQRLHPSAHQIYMPLVWSKRVEIALQIAYALEYLHDVAKPAVVHGDIKSANVLLDDGDKAKLCDFGFSSKAGPNSSVFHSTTASVKGSLGYLDPQYLKNGRLSSKSDVYSFGVLLIELVTGLHAFDMHRAEALTSFTAPYVQDMDMMELIVDARLGGKFDKEELRVLCNVAQRCIQEDSTRRPTMAEVVFNLSSRSTSFTCDQLKEGNGIESSSSSENQEPFLFNSFTSESIPQIKNANATLTFDSS